MASGNYEIYFKVNMTKTKVTTPSILKYLGFGFWKDKNDGQWKARPHQDCTSSTKKSSQSEDS